MREYLSLSNPEIILEQDKLGPKVMVWAGVCSVVELDHFSFLYLLKHLNLLNEKVWHRLSKSVR
jgi:hypothetical protein